MLDIATLTTFLGWCSIINIGLLIYSTLMLTGLRAFVKRVHSRLFAIEADKLDSLYFNFLGNYKLAILILNVVPYCALKIMA